MKSSICSGLLQTLDKFITVRYNINKKQKLVEKKFPTGEKQFKGQA